MPRAHRPEGSAARPVDANNGQGALRSRSGIGSGPAFSKPMPAGPSPGKHNSHNACVLAGTVCAQCPWVGFARRYWHSARKRLSDHPARLLVQQGRRHHRRRAKGSRVDTVIVGPVGVYVPVEVCPSAPGYLVLPVHSRAGQLAVVVGDVGQWALGLWSPLMRMGPAESPAEEARTVMSPGRPSLWTMASNKPL